MTEYATDPETIQEFVHARNRTANWVTVHSTGLQFVTPSAPPSMYSDEDAPSYGPSDSEASSHSVPPRMLLRYNDGRPDIPISNDSASGSRGRSGPSRHSRSRSGSLSPTSPADQRMPPHHAQSLSYASGSRYAAAAETHLQATPENIRILPSASRAPEDPRRARASSTSPQGAFPPHQPSVHDRVPALADPFHPSNRAVHPHAHAPSSRSRAHPQPIPIPASPPSMHPHSQSVPHSSGSRFYEAPSIAATHTPHAPQPGLPYTYAPPAIVYAPSGRKHRSNYQPPAIVYSPSSHAHRRAPGMAYSRSDPTPQPNPYGYSPEASAGHAPYPSAHGSSQRQRHQSMGATMGREREPPRGRSYTPGRDRSRTRDTTPALSESETSSDDSGSTYYVLPSPGQKVQIIVPNAASIYASTPSPPKSRPPPRSGRVSPTSPTSSASSAKRPFFQRLFFRNSGSGSLESRGSSGQGKRLRGRIPVPWRS
ncbi:uncharacterized protein BXZ73DRAFT_53446 [Epithele typhae]|uniref:uncharacterized protein n=1 Tax=Epithele typhae TaxID=378194 RepID=UPI0020080AD1|nr:uncharacterized protein BXZ73DRAFT_53446 [Epithele typhae]KAH9917155.1 hypothetical protein BXZ73DRAFT_53446 [Epithele typhae]